jgi:hypothetical protein
MPQRSAASFCAERIAAIGFGDALMRGFIRCQHHSAGHILQRNLVLYVELDDHIAALVVSPAVRRFTTFRACN